METYQFIETYQKEHVLTIRLNRPKANAFNTPMAFELLDALKTGAEDPQTRCLVITGTGKLFSAGQDLKAISEENITSIRRHVQHTYNLWL